MDNLDLLIRLAIDEDVGCGDITSEACISENSTSLAKIIAKSDMIIAGTDAAKRVFASLDKSIEWSQLAADGSALKSGDVIAELFGKTRALLAGERTALNFLQHLSGIATHTKKFVHALEGTNTKVLDTRKTTPGFRALEKLAVKAGCGVNHRLGLFDQYLIKNNHIAAAGSIAKAVKLAKEKRLSKHKIEVETRTLKDVEEALNAGADVIMLDNMSAADVKRAVELVAGRAKTEASGGINLSNAREYAVTGVDFISIGALTHSARAADIHMLIEPKETSPIKRISNFISSFFK